MMSWVGLVWDIQEHPKELVAEARARMRLGKKAVAA
jgi:hypothetical protein